MVAIVDDTSEIADQDQIRLVAGDETQPTLFARLDDAQGSDTKRNASGAGQSDGVTIATDIFEVTINSAGPFLGIFRRISKERNQLVHRANEDIELWVGRNLC